MKCKTCGGRTSGDVCSYCQEELYILREQADYIDWPLSDEFLAKAEAQRKDLSNERIR